MQNLHKSPRGYPKALSGLQVCERFWAKFADNAQGTLDQLLESSIYKDKSPELVAAQLAELDAWRDAVGYVGQARWKTPLTSLAWSQYCV